MSIKFMKINKYEPAADEKRLEEFAAKGEFIKSHALGMAFFKKGEPKKVKYCIEAAMFRPSRKVRKAYAEDGWKMTARGEDFSVFMSEDENAVPLHTDRSEYAHVIQRFHNAAKRFMILYLIMILIVIIEPYVVFPFFVGGFLYTLLTIMGDVELLDIFIRGLVVTGIVMFLLTGFYMHEYISAGNFIAGSIENGKSAEKAVVRNRVIKSLYIALIVLAVISLSLLLMLRFNAPEAKTDIKEIPQQAITLDDVFGAEHVVYLETDELAEKYLDAESTNTYRKGYATSVSVTSSDLIGAYYQYLQVAAYIPDGEEYGERMGNSGTYTEFKTEWLAKQGIKEYVENESLYFNTNNAEVSEFDVTGTKFETAVYILENNNRVYFALRDGKLMYTLNISIPNNLEITPEEIFERLCKS